MLELDLVKAFHIKYKIPILDNPEMVKKERIDLRITLLNEEIKELEEADAVGNIEEIAKEATDVLYVLLGTTLELGYHKYFETFNLFETGMPKTNRMDSLLQLKPLVEAFKADWSKTNLALILRGVGEYCSCMDLKKDFDSIIHEVHRSNMSKGTNGKPIIRADGKIMKGEDFSPADLSFLNKIV
jgi:predicted HAD superfamily Cof-like phosphohydrolase